MMKKISLSILPPLGLLGMVISVASACGSSDSETSGPTEIPELAPPAVTDQPMLDSTDGSSPEAAPVDEQDATTDEPTAGADGGSHPDAARVDEDGNVISTPAPEPVAPSDSEPAIPVTEDGHVADLPPEPK